MEKEELKQKLKAAWVLRMKIDEFRDQLINLSETGTRITPSYGLAPASSGNNTSKPEQVALAVFELEREINAAIEKQCAALREIYASIDLLDDEMLKLIMVMHYVNLKSWEQIAAETGYSWRWIHKLHSKALEIIIKTNT